MTWKFGVDLNDARLAVTPFFAASGGRYDFRVVQTSLDRGTGTSQRREHHRQHCSSGTPNSVDLRPLILDYNYRWKSGALFVQNDWKVQAQPDA